MFYRRKIILVLIEQLGGHLDTLQIQKLLFITTRNQNKPSYDFVPFKYGCYSFTASSDLNKMVEHGFLAEKNNFYSVVDRNNFFPLLKNQDQIVISKVIEKFKGFNTNDLLKYIYTTFPYWAINSIIAKELLCDEEYAFIQSKRPKSNDTILFTIGYEGISVEEYYNRLLRHDVKLLIDVRNNPMSMKFGFSQSFLKRFCKSLGILYMHLPEVGIQSEKRKRLQDENDYQVLFDDYKKTTLKNTFSTQEKISDLLQSHHRVALTCFEAEISKCHRKHLAESIASHSKWTYELKHL